MSMALGKKKQIVHGSTVATNAILERNGAKTALITNEGFEDIIEIGRQNRTRLYDLSYQKEAHIIPSDLRFGLPGRILQTGEERVPMDIVKMRDTGLRLKELGVESVAICFLFSYVNPFHERAAADFLEPLGFNISQSHEILAEFREFERTSTTVINAVYAITLSAVLYVFRSLVPKDIPTNAGCLRPINFLTRKGSVVDALFPAAVAGGNVEMSQRIVDVVLGALSRAVPETIPAASQGTMNNVTIGGVDLRKGKPFAYYETIGGGMGASFRCNGESAVHCHMTNTMNTPVEALEYSYPFLVTEYSVRRGTGGHGHHKGGDGIVREIELLSDAEVTVLSERRRIPPYGLFGGEPGSVGKNVIIRNKGSEQRGGKFSASLNKGDRLRIETPGGGGYGLPG
ncbi:MAG: hydantoinase B/oxoprolinase family protein [Desulfobacterales bacterium]